jgi:hypothetical protein
MSTKKVKRERDVLLDQAAAEDWYLQARWFHVQETRFDTEGGTYVDLPGNIWWSDVRREAARIAESAAYAWSDGPR